MVSLPLSNRLSGDNRSKNILVWFFTLGGQEYPVVVKRYTTVAQAHFMLASDVAAYCDKLASCSKMYNA